MRNNWKLLNQRSFTMLLPNTHLYSIVYIIAIIIQCSQANLPPLFLSDMNNLVIPENTPLRTQVYILKAEDPEGSSLRYGLMGTDKLSVDEKTGVVTVVKPIDREVVDKLKVTVTVEDVVESGGENNLVTLPVQIQISDENDHSPIFQNKSAFESLEVIEDTKIGTKILSLSITDPDLTGLTLNLSCTPLAQSPEACQMFPIEIKEATSGHLKATATLGHNLNYNKRSLYQMVLTATDGEHKSSAGVLIRIKDVQNSPPIFDGAMSGRVPEDAPVGSLIMVLKASDGDMGNAREIQISLLSNPGDSFHLDSRNGHLTTTRPLDREVLGTLLNLEVSATEVLRNEEELKENIDYSLIQTLANITVLIDDIDDFTPTFNQKEFWTEINENTPAGTALPNIDMIVFDEDSGTNADFILRVEGPLSDLFQIEPKFASGTARPVIRVNKAFDHENPNERKFLILVVAQNIEEPGLFSTCTISVIVNDQNDNRPSFEKDLYTLSVPENTKPLTKIGSIVANDPDSNEYGQQGLTYTLVGSGKKKFTVNSKTGDLYVGDCVRASSSSSNNNTVVGNDCLDYETQKTFDLFYMASDNHKKDPFTHSIVPLQISITDYNDNEPYFVQRFERVIEEDAKQFEPRFFVEAKDIDKTAVISYKILEPHQRFFRLDENTAEITIKGQSLPPGNYSFDVEAFDGIHKVTTPVVINVTDTNNNSPIFDEKTQRVLTISEDIEIGTVIMVLKAKDKDLGKNGKIRYSIDKGGFGYFEISKRTGEIMLMKELDTDERAKFQLHVSATDGGDPPQRTSTVFHITVSDVYAPLPKITPLVQKVSVSESAQIGSVVGKILTNAQELGINERENQSRLSFEFVLPVHARNLDNKVVNDLELFKSWFVIEQDGRIRVASELHREIVSNINITVMITSENSRPSSRNFGTLLINVFEVNDHAPKIEDMEIETYEELPKGMTILTMTAIDPEGGQISSYYIQEGAEYLSIDNKTGEIKVAGRLDYEEKPVYNITVVAVDSGVPQMSSTGTIHIQLVNINDNSPVFTQTEYKAEVPEHSPEGTVVTTVSAKDADGDVINYDLDAGSSGIYYEAFRIDRFGQIVVTKEGESILDREKMPNSFISIGVRAKDSQRTGYAKVIIKVKDINDVKVKMDVKSYQTVVHTPLRHGQELLKVTGNGGDLPETDKLKYKIVKGNDGDLFEIDQNSGSIRVAKAFEKPQDFRLVIEVTDNEEIENSIEHKDQAGVFIQVLPGNFKKPEFLFPNKINSTLITTESDKEETAKFAGGDYSKVLGQLIAVDSDEGPAGQILYYFKDGDNLISETDEFRVEKDTGKIHQIKALDREETNKYNLLVIAKDKGNPVSSQSYHMLTIAVDDIDDHKSTFLQKVYNFKIKENSLENSFIGKVEAVDEDEEGPNAQIFYFLVSEEKNRFINANIRVDIKTGTISTNAILDRERIDSYRIFVLASPSPLINRSSEIITYEEAQIEPSIAIVNIMVEDLNDNAPRFSRKIYYAGISSDAEPGREILTLKATDADPSSIDYIQYSLLGSNLILDDFKSGGSVIPSPFRIDQLTGRLTISESAMRQYGGGNNRFLVKIGARESIPPYHQDSTEVQVWVVESTQEIVLAIKTPPMYMLREELVDLFENITGYHILINKITPHIAEDDSVNKDWSDVYVTPIDKKLFQIVPVGRFLQALDLGHDKLTAKQKEMQFELYSAVPAVGKTSFDGEYFFGNRDSFDTAFAALVALVALLCLGVASILAICCCINRMRAEREEAQLAGMKYPLHPASIPGTPITRSHQRIIGQPEMIEDMATDNPLWIENKLKTYEEQELTMQVMDNSNNGTEDGLSINEHVMMSNNRQQSPQFSHAYATLHHPPEWSEKYDNMNTLPNTDSLAVHL